MSNKDQPLDIQGAVCPVPLPKDTHIVMGHGSGGKLMHDLIQQGLCASLREPGVIRR